jgi:hypothetical protein
MQVHWTNGHVIAQVGNGNQRFTYDHVFGGNGQHPDNLYSACVENLVEGLFKGYNATVSNRSAQRPLCMHLLDQSIAAPFVLPPSPPHPPCMTSALGV